MRKDALGLFWHDEPEVKVKKEAPPKRQPPERVWERPDYLPGLEEALAFNVPLYTDEELLRAAFTPEFKEPLMFDTESYPNYWQIAFTGLRSGKVIDFRITPDTPTLNYAKLRWVIENFTIVGFFSRDYDIPMLSLAMAGKDPALLWAATSLLINENEPWRAVLARFKVKRIKADHIDLKEVAPLFASLKIYNGRMHGELMQDLPFPPGTMLTYEQAAIVGLYCINDLRATAKLYLELEEQITLRYDIGQKYGLDVRSKSDAQIAEAVIGHEFEVLTGSYPSVPEIPVGTAYRYEVPSFISFKTPLMQRVLEIVRNAYFVVADHGSIAMPAELAKLQMTIGTSTYTMGIGGLHSTEKKAYFKASENYTLRDRDVTSFYPMIIMILELFPDHLGPNFLRIFGRILGERVEAKQMAAKFKKMNDKQKEAVFKVIAASLKIVANGTYGKLGNRWSIVYSPRLLTQITITGQLVLLMLIEAMELASIRVVSANTDGFVSYVHKTQEQTFLDIVTGWEKATGFTTEETMYKALYSRDVNNYVALKGEGKFKSKGAFFDPWGQKAMGEAVADECLKKNPQNQICIEAVVKFLDAGVPIDKTIEECRDITRFVSVRTVGGGACKVWPDRTEYLGKAIRWYYASGVDGEIIAVKTGNKVPKTDGAKPLMKLPNEFPSDVNYEWYIDEAQKLLEWLGYV